MKNIKLTSPKVRPLHLAKSTVKILTVKSSTKANISGGQGASEAVTCCPF